MKEPPGPSSVPKTETLLKRFGGSAPRRPRVKE